IGAVLVKDGQMLGEGFNQPISADDPTAHAEIMAIRHAAKRLGNYRLPGTTLYVTIEPCTMCAGALIHARVDTLVFGAREPRAGSVVSQARLLEEGRFNHQVGVCEGVCSEQCSALMRNFFHQQRARQ
ncbi:MAG: tRNA adenosine(34) deaminase TadA, partial [Gammaproteobacteria bacterium]|nr:tRNA adenosine(34) deaminase TadA [Gammaproteobacteria bacterium]